MVRSPLAVTALVAAVTALAFWLDRNVPALSRVGASLMVIVFGALLSNLGVVPARSPVYEAIAGPVTSLAIAWLLLAVHLNDLKRAGPRMLAAFGLAAAGTVAGAALGTVLFGAAFGEESWKLTGAITGTYTGGSLNFVAVGRGLEIPETLFAGAAAADNLTTGLWMAACLVFPVWIGRWYPAAVPRPAQDGEPSGPAAEGQVAGDEADGAAGHPFFSTAPLSVLGLARLFALGLLLLLLAELVGRIVPQVPRVLWLTTLALAVGHLPRFSGMEGAMQLGNYALHLFFAVIGILSRVGEILTVGLSVFFFTLTVVGVHGLVVFGVGRLARLDVGTLAVASQAAVGGPSTALAIAVSRRWRALVLPGIAVGLLGYAVGNYLGFAMAWLVR